MATTINADNGVSSGSAGLKYSSDSTGVLALQTNGTTAVSVSTGQVVTLAQPLPVVSGGTGGATYTANNVLLGNGTSAFQTVAPGTNGNLLTSNGTTWTSAAAPSGMVYPGSGIANSTGSAWGTSYSTTGTGTVVALATSPTLTSPAFSGTPTGVGVLTSGTAVASTSGTSIDFTSIPSWVKRVTINFQGVSTNGTAEPLIKIGTSGGIQSSGYLGASCFLAVGSMGARPYSTAPASSTGYAFFNDVTAAALRNGAVTLTLLDSSNGTWALNGMLGDSQANFMCISAGSKTLSGTLDRVRVTTTNGTDAFDAGSINILYE
jgi:hypothetical protein